MRLALLVFSPVILLAALEAGLRAGGYGYPVGFFIQGDQGDRYETNDRFGWRFFSRDLARPPNPGTLSAKPAGVIRIFVLGESAAMGTPDPAFSFGNILAVLLRERFPDARFEIVNGAMVAINSHAVREIARDCAAFDPDLFVVYMGNNEVIGPYGPGTVFQRWTMPLWMIRASLQVRATRVGQLLGQVVAVFSSNGSAPGRWRGMEMFLENPVAADDARLAAVYRHFRRNLSDICAIAQGARAPVILSTVAVNLKDCPPFASHHRADLDPQSRRRWELACQEGAVLEEGRRLPEAIRRYEAAAEIDERYAELPFRLGRCLLKEQRVAEAQSCFERARDLDVLRFRADSRLNGIIRDVASERAAAGVRLADAERELGWVPAEAKDAPAGDLFYEHVHLTFDGNYRLARAVADQVCAALPGLCKEGTPGAFPTRQRCAELLAYTPWDEARLLADMVKMTARPPFTHQLDHESRQAGALRHLQQLRERAASPQALEEAWKSYETAVAAMPDDASLRRRFGQFAMYRGRFEAALEHLRAARTRLPWDSSLHNEFGVALSGRGQFEDAALHFRAALQRDPHNLDAYDNLGLLLAGRDQLDQAAAFFQKALAVDPDHGPTHAKLGQLMASRGRLDEAIDHFGRSLKSDPDNALVSLCLGDALLAKNRGEGAEAHYRKALEIDPQFAQAHNNLGLLLANRGQTEEALVHYRRALELNPGLAECHNNLGMALARSGRTEEAVAHYRKSLELNPRNAAVHNNYGVLLASGHGRLDEAIACFEKALELDPTYERARQNLEHARSLRSR